jgi:molecular chaperone DnaK (HSP70)
MRRLHSSSPSSSIPSPILLLTLLLSLLSLLTLLPTLTSSAEPPKSRPVPISIDFGSEFIKVSSVRPGAGSYHIVVDEQSKRKIPAVVSFEGGERHFGNGATQLTMRKPAETYWFAHRLLGKGMGAPEVEGFTVQGYPYELVEMEGRGSVGVRHRQFDGSEVVLSAEELVAMSLEHIVKISEADAETFLSGATLTVPNFFTQVERQALLDSADLASLNVYALVNENTAAAIQYGIDRTYTNETEPHTILLYNMGSTSTNVK